MVATLTQFSSADSVRALERGTASPELKRLLRDQEIAKKVADGYDVAGVLVTNVNLDKNASEFWEHNSLLRVFQKERLAAEYVDTNSPEGIKGSFSFTIDDGVLEYSAGSDANMYLILAKASELVRLKGLADQTLFSQNVRLSLGNTSVNKGIVKSVLNSKVHNRFPLFHNGITLLAKEVDVMQNEDIITVNEYVVVNGAQSLTALYNNEKSITKDLRVLLRIVEIGENQDLGREITTISNNQNAIKPRDHRSNNVSRLSP